MGKEIQTCQSCGRPLLSGWFDDASQSVITTKGKRIRFSPFQWKILSHLRKRQGCPTSLEQMYSAIYGYRDDPPSDNNIRVQIYYMRFKLAETPVRIETRKGAGYIMDIERAAA